MSVPCRWSCWRMSSTMRSAVSSTVNLEFSTTTAPSAICNGDALRPESFMSRRWIDCATPSGVAGIFMASKSRVRRIVSMEGEPSCWWIVGTVVVLVLLYLAWAYNRLVSLNKRADGAWSDIDVQLKRRWDLVPALVETVKGYSRHESSTLENVVEARSQATQAGSLTERGQSERGLRPRSAGCLPWPRRIPS